MAKRLFVGVFAPLVTAVWILIAPAPAFPATADSIASQNVAVFCKALMSNIEDDMSIVQRIEESRAEEVLAQQQSAELNRKPQMRRAVSDALLQKVLRKLEVKTSTHMAWCR